MKKLTLAISLFFGFLACKEESCKAPASIVIDRFITTIGDELKDFSEVKKKEFFLNFNYEERYVQDEAEDFRFESQNPVLALSCLEPTPLSLESFVVSTLYSFNSIPKNSSINHLLQPKNGEKLIEHVSKGNGGSYLFDNLYFDSFPEIGDTASFAIYMKLENGQELRDTTQHVIFGGF